jgi:hypothetical protein
MLSRNLLVIVSKFLTKACRSSLLWTVDIAQIFPGHVE